MGILWIIVVGFVAGIIARFLSPGPHNPAGFILTTLLGIVGAFLATFIGQAIGWYRPDQGAGFIAATVGAVIILFVWHRLKAVGGSPIPRTGLALDAAFEWSSEAEGAGERAQQTNSKRRSEINRATVFRAQETISFRGISKLRRRTQ